MKRNIYPGEEWIYFKIYISPMSANSILIESIYPSVQDLLNEEIISQWFYIRYSDPDFHIRLRLKLNSTDFIGPAIAKVRKYLENDIISDAISKIQIDTYQREIERYGKDTMEDCELFFCHDSQDVLESIKDKPQDWQIIVKCINWVSRLLTTIEFSDNDIYEIADAAVSSYAIEFRLNNDQLAEINLLYRKNKQDILDIVKESKCKVADSYDSYKLKWLKNHENKRSIIFSLIHMHCNRIFSYNQRLYECIVYSLLKKAYQTMAYKSH